MSHHILFEQRRGLGLITLNRPQALNAADTDMARAMLHQLNVWADDSTIECVAVQGVGKAFCAGGDIRAIHGMQGDAMRFFKPEYDLCRYIHAYPKPYVALMDGVTMGGGVGLSIYGSHRIATPNTLWAMPECAIGFYPDIGATWFLSHLPGEMGVYLGLTGARLKAGDLLALGIATGFSDDVESVIKDLESEVLPLPWGEVARSAGEGIDKFSPLTPALSPREREVIDRCFDFNTVEEIVATLEAENTEWSDQTLTAMRRGSPTSLKVTLAQMRHGKTLNFDQAIDLEYRLTEKFLTRPDFFEGVRAMLIDRDGKPAWQPATLEEVTPAMVGSFFASAVDQPK